MHSSLKHISKLICVMETINSAETVLSNKDLLTEILIRLPIRSVLLYKSVSKHWLSLITNPQFSLLIKPCHGPPSGLFLQSCSYPTPKYEYIPFNIENPSNPPFQTLNFIPRHFGIKIIQSCNGLLCCCSSQWHTHNCNYYVYNPTTKQFTTIPLVPGSGTSKTSIFGMILAFDASRSPHYKVICVRGSEMDYNHHQIEIYSSKTGSWQISGQPFITNDTYFPSGVYWNDGIHWTKGSCYSLHFMIKDERVETMALPPQPDRSDEGFEPSYFGESCGHLHLVEAYGPRNSELKVYEMGKDYSGWYKKYQVDLDDLPVAFPEMIRTSLNSMDRNNYLVEILSLVRGEKEEDSFIVLEIPGKAIRYNIVDKTFKKLCAFCPNESESVSLDVDEQHLRFRGGTSFQYIESLSCV